MSARMEIDFQNSCTSQEFGAERNGYINEKKKSKFPQKESSVMCNTSLNPQP